MSILIIAFSSMFAGILSGIVGTGSSIILLPILVMVFGTKAAIPIMAIAALIANCGRVYIWWNEIDWRAVFFYALPSIPMAAVGANLLIAIPESVSSTILGVFFLALIPIRYVLRSRNIGSKPIHLLSGGALIGFITGLVASSGPLSLAVFSSFGLVKSALIATEAAASLFVFGSKAATFSYLNVMSYETLLGGLLVGSFISVGTFAAKFILNRLNTRHHDRMIDFVLAGSGLSMVIS
ncbi:Sulfite exporter TauE/SafE [Pseudovibrio axinellae]|uniref:Probable membrane transporter protein n=1 Tax=Pseudovibrio axinellae TaxID=989403 RepID=A0A165SYQ8_9HYPH|nr:sulfite exporter TauE/SafE family protein [Pseudovibrio axinellae]KZL05032.1 Sulfite exporter TauE/SafE [Pseudovibrio axinellae]SER65414.1 hypothetical protein SAMN05421798_11536 [Pseudovibrio axinellae]